ncbi:glycosyltransferase [Trueperella pyogenes]|uniref:glycosyltransferase n=1 Tax=Trueperella pyogenes TaxID=1661 RepID=UPI00345D4DBE
MRIVQVSAHYPPDFISGGALIPQRFAEELARRGHESAVFTGRLKGLAPGKVLDEQRGSVRVRWVGNSDALAWSDRRNFDNSVMYEPFAQFLDEVRPDIVHVHSLQTIGGKILEMAKDAGASVVVTMHDFWWTCARQFLVDRKDTPCSPVVSAGGCECEAGRSHLEERNAWLAKQLTHADLILFPSESARQLMIANGVAPAKTAVNENGVDRVASSGERDYPSQDRPVRFMYTGGEAVMKGYEVLKAACAGAHVPAGTKLDLYNTDDAGFPAWASTQPAYGREDLPRIFGEHDVLILPSVMRESHSIVTREALAAGMAVIVTDSFGPEEAVADGVNGCIVASGSALDLREAIEALAQPEVTRELLDRGSASPIVSVTEQLDDLEKHYQRLAVRTDSDPLTAADALRADSAQDVVHDAVAHLIRQVVIVVGIDGAMARYRAHLPAEGLALRGITAAVMHYRDPQLPQAALSADAVVFYRVPATHQVLDLIAQIKALPRVVPVIGDVDDLIFDPEIFDSLDNLGGLSADERALWMRGIHRYRTTFDACDYFIGSTQTVSREAERLLGVPTQTYANGVGALLGAVSDAEARRARTPGPLRIGFFSGTDTHDADWASIEPGIVRVLRERPEVELWLGGHVEPTAALAQMRDRIVRIPFVAWHKLPSYLRDIDVCLAPLTADSIFNEAKSAIKWLEAALVETATVASPSQPFREAIDDGVTGFLASDADSWVDAIETLLDDGALRRRIGRQAKRAALLSLSPDLQGRAYADILVDAWRHVQRHGHKAAGSFTPVVDDEPAAAAVAYLERYEVPQAQAFGTIRMILVKTIHSLRVAGLRATLAKVMNKLRVGG